LEKLDLAQERPLALWRQAEYMARAFESALPAWLAESERDWRALYLPELDNVRAALDYAFAGGPEAAGLALAASSGPLWTHLSLWVEGAERLERALEHVRDDTPRDVVARL